MQKIRLYRNTDTSGKYWYAAYTGTDLVYKSAKSYDNFVAMLIKDGKPMFNFNRLDEIGMGDSHRPYHSHAAEYLAVIPELYKSVNLPEKKSFSKFTVSNKGISVSLIASSFEDFTEIYVQRFCKRTDDFTPPEESKVRAWLSTCTYTEEKVQ